MLNRFNFIHGFPQSQATPSKRPTVAAVWEGRCQALAAVHQLTGRQAVLQPRLQTLGTVAPQGAKNIGKPWEIHGEINGI